MEPKAKPKVKAKNKMANAGLYNLTAFGFASSNL